jgi:hypothetical protein
MADWFEELAKAVKARDVAIAGRERWQVKVDEAERAIQDLTAARDAVPPMPSADAQQEEIAAAIPPEMLATFTAPPAASFTTYTQG